MIPTFRRTSAHTRRMATCMASTLVSSDNRAQAALARLEALESNNAGVRWSMLMMMSTDPRMGKTLANLESLPPHIPTYLRAALGRPSTSSRQHYCSVCGSSAKCTCVRCRTRFCSCAVKSYTMIRAA